MRYVIYQPQTAFKLGSMEFWIGVDFLVKFRRGVQYLCIGKDYINLSLIEIEIIEANCITVKDIKL